MITDETAGRWAARPVQAALIRIFAFLLPIAGSVVFIHFASGLVVMPTSSFLLFVSWWVLMSGAATLVLVGIERACRRLLPLVALYKLSLVFPDAAPSRFRNAMRSNTAETLAERVARAKAHDDGSTPVEAAERLLALVADLNVHDRLTRGHSDRVRAYSQMIGKELHLSANALDLLNWAALLHDVGKLNVPVEILANEGSPTAEEWEILRRHPEFGQELTAPLGSWLGEWSRAVPQHHERWDGKGYPAGISGEEIGLAARIVAVADVFDVITSARSYKSAFSSNAARDEIARCAGTQFDPRVVRAFLNISLGRLRLVMGPLSWLAHVPVLARLPLTPAIGAVAASAATVAAAVTTGIIATPPTPGLASTVRPQLHSTAHQIERVTREDETLVVSVARTTGGGRVTSMRLLGQPTVGRVRVTAGHEILYSPPPDFSGSVSLRYEACVAGHGCRRGVLVVRVLPVDDPPIARDDTATTSQGKPVTIDVLANDSDVEGDRLSILGVSGIAGGRARITGEQIRWSPPPKLVGKTSFRYTVTDHHGGRAGALVTVRIKRKAGASRQQAQIPPSPPAPPAEPAPVSKPSAPAPPAAVPATTADAPPQARVDELSVPEGATVVVDVLANDSDPNGDPLTLVSVGTPAHGSARKVGERVQYTASADYVGRVTFPYTIADPQGGRDTSSVAVTVLLVNEPPSFTAGPDQTVPEDAGSQAIPGWALSISPGTAAESGQTVSFLVSNDNNGLFSAQPAVAADGTLTYTPAANANGSATVTLRAQDNGPGAATSAPQTFTITVVSVNDPPSANADSATVAEDDPAGVTFDVLANDTDVDTGDTRSLLSFDGSTIADGTLVGNGGGSFTYIPDPGFNGTETFTYVVADGSGATASGTVTITITPVPHPPVAGEDAYTTVQGTTLSVALPGVLGNDGDPDGDPITIQTTPVTGPTGGGVTLAVNGSFVYTPNATFVGTDSFTYRIDDTTGRSAIGLVVITVTSAPALPSTLYFQRSGPTADIWDMMLTLPPPAPQLADFDGDGKPGLTIKDGDLGESTIESSKFQIWTYTTPAPLVLNGPVRLDLWSSDRVFSRFHEGQLKAFLYDCTPGGASDPQWSGCTKIASNTVFRDPWNTSFVDWGYRAITIGSVNRTISPFHELRVRILFHRDDLWLTMTPAYPTALVVTLG